LVLLLLLVEIPSPLSPEERAGYTGVCAPLDFFSSASSCAAAGFTTTCTLSFFSGDDLLDLFSDLPVAGGFSGSPFSALS